MEFTKLKKNSNLKYLKETSEGSRFFSFILLFIIASLYSFEIQNENNRKQNKG